MWVSNWIYIAILHKIQVYTAAERNKREKSRSRSPVSRDSKHYKRDGKFKFISINPNELNVKSRLDRKYSSSSDDSDKNEHKQHPATPPAPKISIQPAKGIQIKLASQPKPAPLVQKTKVSNVFNPDESDEEEEMPPEAKMRMKNIGKDTPTSSGPNSFGKTKQGRLNFEPTI